MRLSDIQKSVLNYLQEQEDWKTIIDIADSLFVHPNSARSATTKLTTNGLIERGQQRDGKKGRPTFVFRARTTRFNVLHDAFHSIEQASEEEKSIIESVISGKFENALAHSLNLVQDLADFLRNLGIETNTSKNTLTVEPSIFSKIEHNIPGFASRVIRVISQQAVGQRASVTLSPNYIRGECVLTVNET